MKERVQIKHDTAENWAKAVNFIPLAGELIIYDGIMEDGKYLSLPRIKVGDGVHIVNNLPFVEMVIEKSSAKYEDGVLKM